MNKTEHEKLKEICESVGFKLNEDYYYYDETSKHFKDCYWDCRCIDVREIVFTQEFMKKVYKYYKYPLFMISLQDPILEEIIKLENLDSKLIDLGIHKSSKDIENLKLLLVELDKEKRGYYGAVSDGLFFLNEIYSIV